MENAQSAQQERILEIELMKAVAVIGMVFVHVFEMGVNLDYHSPCRFAAASLIEFLGAVPSAGVFMFAMGWGAAYSKNATVKSYLRRAVTLFELGLVINVFEEYLPALLAPGSYGPLSGKLPSILAADIYFFAALASLYFALMKKLESNNRLRILVSVLIVGLCFCINALIGFETFTTGNEWLDTALGLLIRVNEYSYFPFISWIVFPVTGYGAAFYCRRNGRKKTLNFAVWTGAAALLISSFLVRMVGMPDAMIVDVVNVRDGVYYALHPIYAVTAYGIIMLEFVLAGFILRAAHNHIPGFMLTMSKNVAQIYMVQWIVIALLSPVLAVVSNIWVNILIGFFVLVVSYYGGKLLKKMNLIHA